MKIYLAVVAYGSVECLWVQSLIKLIESSKIPLEIAWNVGDSLVSRSRNTITAAFLKSDCTDLLFIDTDIGFEPEHVARLCQHDRDIVAGYYPKKQEGTVNWVCNARPDGSPVGEDGLQDLLYAGTGFMRIRRRVFDQMIGAFGKQIGYVADDSKAAEHDFWGVGVYTYADGTRRYLSEDWMFCQRALDLGFKVWGDTHIMLHHVGKMTFPNKAQMDEIRGKNVEYDAKRKQHSPSGGGGQEFADSSSATSDRITQPVTSEQVAR